MIGENAEPLDGWALPPRCCGTWCVGLSCDVCGNWVTVPANIVLSEN